IQWVNDYNNSGSFKAKDNRSEEENELNKLCKEIKQLQMKNEVISIFRASKNNYGSRKIKIK
ncbi:MAG: IS3 family transposase, partial [Lactococcus sp.]